MDSNKLRSLVIEEGIYLDRVYIKRELREIAKKIKQEPATAKALAEMFNMSPPLMHRELRILEEKGYVKRIVLPHCTSARWYATYK